MKPIGNLLSGIFARQPQGAELRIAFAKQQGETALREWAKKRELPGELRIVWIRAGSVGIACQEGVLAEAINRAGPEIITLLKEACAPLPVTRIGFGAWDDGARLVPPDIDG